MLGDAIGHAIVHGAHFSLFAKGREEHERRSGFSLMGLTSQTLDRCFAAVLLAGPVMGGR